jgi:hypothetical protein
VEGVGEAGLGEVEDGVGAGGVAGDDVLDRLPGGEGELLRGQKALRPQPREVRHLLNEVVDRVDEGRHHLARLVPILLVEPLGFAEEVPQHLPHLRAERLHLGDDAIQRLFGLILPPHEDVESLLFSQGVVEPRPRLPRLGVDAALHSPELVPELGDFGLAVLEFLAGSLETRVIRRDKTGAALGSATDAGSGREIPQLGAAGPELPE